MNIAWWHRFSARTTMINYFRTNEQTWSKHGQEAATGEGKGTIKKPGYYVCA
jgi:hypothetical protein